MRACPCCLEMLTPGLLGLGARQVAGRCEGCGDAVCQSCLTRRSVPGREGARTRGRVCRSCEWELLTNSGETPSFPAPPGQRERAARAARQACAHPRVKRWMGFCPDCGDEVGWTAEHGNPVCDACGAPSHRLFNHCWACGESFDEENTPQPVAKGYRLDVDCDAGGCAGKLAWLMPFCPWCGEAKHWRHSQGDDLGCGECERGLDRAWAFCVSCGEEAPLPDTCPRCDLELEKAHSAARCEECRNIVCGDCFEFHGQERLLCSACGAESETADSADPPADVGEEEAREEPAAPTEAPPPSPWEVLGVKPQTPLPEVRKAYLALVAQYHPDKVALLGPKLQALAQEETRRIIEAWEQVRQRSR